MKCFNGGLKLTGGKRLKFKKKKEKKITLIIEKINPCKNSKIINK